MSKKGIVVKSKLGRESGVGIAIGLGTLGLVMSLIPPAQAQENTSADVPELSRATDILPEAISLVAERWSVSADRAEDGLSLQQPASDLSTFLADSHEDVFGGTVIDNSREGLIVVRLTDDAPESLRSAVVSEFPDPSSIEVVKSDFSLQQLKSYVDDIVARKGEYVEVLGSDFTVGLLVSEQSVTIGVPRRNEEFEKVIKGDFPNMPLKFEVVTLPEPLASCADSQNCNQNPARRLLK